MRTSEYWIGKREAYQDALNVLIEKIALRKGAYDYSTGMVLTELHHDLMLFVKNCERLADEAELREVHEKLANENKNAEQIMQQMSAVD